MAQQQEIIQWTTAFDNSPAVDGIYLISDPSGFWGTGYWYSSGAMWQNFIGEGPSDPVVVAWANLPRGYQSFSGTV